MKHMQQPFLILLLALLSSTNAWNLPDFMKEYEAVHVAQQQLQHQQQQQQHQLHLSSTTSANTVKIDRGLQNGVDATAPSIAATEETSTSSPTVPPTASPTESPAPSPSPSWTPTSEPTGTARPTGQPSPFPTESPAPSPGPSWTPSFAPSPEPSTFPSMYPTITPVPTYLPSKSPSAVPSFVPTQVPSDVPTVSLMPSEVPSHTPTQQPSAMPTMSLMPSGAPSGAPSLSNQPSAMPSHIESQTASFAINVALTELLNFTQVKAFEKGTAEWLENKEFERGRLSDVTVRLQDQALVVATTPDNRRRLQDVPPQVLLLNFAISATYSGTDANFDLFDELNPEFQEPNTLWLRYLGDQDEAFRQLDPVFAALEDMGVSEDQGLKKITHSTGMSPGSLAMLLFVAIGATLLGIAASVYAIESYRTAVYGLELTSPKSGGSSGSGDEFDASEQESAMENGEKLMPLPSYATQVMPGGVRSVPSSTSFGATSYISRLTTADQGQNPDGLGPTLSQYSLGDSASQINGKKPEATPTYSHMQTARHSAPHHKMYGEGRTHQDPPSAASDVGVSSKEPEIVSEKRRILDAGHTPYVPPREEYRQNALIDNTSLAESSREASALEEPKFQNDAQYELMLTRSMGGTLGAAAVDGSQVNGSEFSSQANSFFASLVNQRQEKKENEGVLGGRARLSQGEVSGGSSRRAGLFDVFAPPGYIGIIVDTTKHGPVVHSLKPTSPMLGLINPGDLIVGLDDQDTRSMTAATLTKLMAKKANQKERKITLLAASDY